MKRHYVTKILLTIAIILICASTLGCGLPEGGLDREGCISLYDNYIDQCKDKPYYLLDDTNPNQSHGFCGQYDECIGVDGYLTKCIEDNQDNCQAVYECIENR